MGRRPLGRVFRPLARKRGNRLKKNLHFYHKQDLKFGINSGKNLPYNHINRYFFQHILGINRVLSLSFFLNLTDIIGNR